MATTKAYALGRLGNKLSVNGTDVDIGGKIKTEISAPAITIDAANTGGKTPVGDELFPNGGLENAIANGWTKTSEVSFISSKHGDNTVANILSTDGRSAYIQKAVTLTAGKRYLIQFDLVRYKSGVPRLIYNGPGYSVASLDQTTTLGTKSIEFTPTASGATTVRFTRSGSTCDFDIDNLSMKEVAAKNTASLKLQGHVDVGDTISSLSISNNDTEFASINTVRQGTTAGDTTIATTGELILNAGTGITIDGNNVTNQPVLHISNMGSGNTGIILSRTGQTGHISIGEGMNNSMPLFVSATNRSLGYLVRGGLGNASYAAHWFSVDANASNHHPAVMGVRSANNNSLIFQGEQSDSTVVFSVDYDGNVATSGTVDGVDIAARDAVLTSTTTTANDALPKTGGTITGDVTATTVNATTVDLGDWTITEASGSLLFATQGVTKMKLDSSGNLDVVGNINSSAYIPPPGAAVAYDTAALIVNGKNPSLAFDFANSYYRNSGNDSTFANSINHSRASSATMTNSSGNIVSVGIGVPRLDHHVYNGSAWVNEGILHESEARTNMLTYSLLAHGSGWTQQYATLTLGATTAPDGTSNASSLVESTSSSKHQCYSTGIVTGATTTYSIWIKANTRSEILVSFATAGQAKGAFFNLLTGEVGTVYSGYSASIVEGVDGWYRCSVTFTPSSSGTYYSAVMMSVSESSTYTGDGTSGIYIWGAQVERGATPSSYIPTSGSTATRAPETLTVPAAKLPYSSTNVSTQMNGKMTYADNNSFNEVAFLRQFVTGNYLKYSLYTNSSNTGKLDFTQYASAGGGSKGVNTSGSYFTPGINVPFNIAGRHGSTFVNGAEGGSVMSANTSMTALPNLSSADLELGETFMGTIGKFRMWDEDIGDTGIAIASS